jgi:hypothetical protein
MKSLENISSAQVIKRIKVAHYHSLTCVAKES